ncbi:MAG: Wzz/FepE/Etk N-terminal domain-containing protein [Candidatus Competibacterales bacterium]
MTGPLPSPLPYDLNDDLDLLAYISALWRAKYIIALLAIAASVGMYFYAKTLPPRYHAFAHLALIEPEEPGGVTPDNRRAPEVFTLVEHGFVLDSPAENYRHRVLARMRSRLVTKGFLETHDILPQLFPDHWDSRAAAWREGFSPNLELAYRIFHQRIRSITFNPENQLIGVHMYWHNPHQAAQWANDFVAYFNAYMRDKTIADVQARLAYLEEILADKVSLGVEMTQSIYRLMEAEAHKAMLTRALNEYTLEILDPAVAPLEPFAPSAAKWAVAVGAAAGFFGVALVVARVMVGKLRRALQQYSVRGSSPS